MQVIHDRPQTISLSTVVKHPENYMAIIGMIKFNKLNYLYKLVRLGRDCFIWANLAKPCCYNDSNDSNDAKTYHTTQEALQEFLTGGDQEELHVFNRKEDYIEFLTKYM